MLFYQSKQKVCKLLSSIMERFPIECRKTKTKVITLANQNRVNNTTSQSGFEASTCNRRQARKNACGENTIGFVWIPIGWESGASLVNQLRSVVMPNRSKREITFDTELQTALYELLNAPPQYSPLPLMLPAQWYQLMPCSTCFLGTRLREYLIASYVHIECSNCIAVHVIVEGQTLFNVEW